MSSVGIVFRIGSFKILLPSISGKVRRQEAYPVRSIVLDFPGLITIRKTIDFRRSLVIVEIILADKAGRCPVVMEHYDRETVDGLTDTYSPVLHSWSGGCHHVEEPCQFYVVGAF